MDGCCGERGGKRGPPGLTYDDILKLKCEDIGPDIFAYSLRGKTVIYNNGLVMTEEEYYNFEKDRSTTFHDWWETLRFVIDTFTS